MPNDVLARTTGWRFLNDVMAHHEIAWGNYHILTGQQDNVLAQLSFLHIHMRCVVKLDLDENCEDEMSRDGICLVCVPTD